MNVWERMTEKKTGTGKATRKAAGEADRETGRRRTGSRPRALLFTTSLALFPGLLPGIVLSQTMEDLGLLAGGSFSIAYAISADGATVVGSADSATGAPAFLWSEGTGMQELEGLPGSLSTAAYGVSGDGTAVVGRSIVGTDNRAFFWSAGTGMVDLGTLAGGSFSTAWAVSGDGGVVVGESMSAGGLRAFRWSEGTGMVDLGTLAGGDISSALGVNADGSVVVGESQTGSGARAFRWSEGTGMVDLGTLAGGSYSIARAVNADGGVVVGESATGAGIRAFRGSEGTGMVDLGLLSGGSYSIARAVNDSGSVVVGNGDTGAGVRAFRWSEGSGMVDLGVLSGGSYSVAYGVSGDGNIVVGESDSASGVRAFIYRNTMLDLINTQTAITWSAGDQAAAIGMRNAGLDAARERELEVRRPASGTQPPPMALRLEGSLTANAETASAGFAAITGAVGIGERLVLGGFLSTGAEISTQTGFSMSGGQPAAGIYLRSRDVLASGVTWKLALAGLSGAAQITRSALLADTEPGTGAAALDGSSASFELGYTIVGDDGKLTPFLRLAGASTTRSAYTETDAVSFPVSFDAYDFTETTLTLGLGAARRIGAETILRFGFGVEADLYRSSDPVTGTSDIPGLTSFSVAGPAVLNPVRVSASLGLARELDEGRQVRFDADLGQSAYTDALTATVALGYESQF